MEHFKELTKMSFTKLRLSWGRIGNNNVGSHSYLSNIGNGRSDWWIGSTNPLSFGTPTVAATTLTWEPVETIDLGINTKFFDNSLDIEFDWFKRTTLTIIAIKVAFLE